MNDMTMKQIMPDVLEITVGSAGGSAWGIRLAPTGVHYLNVPYSHNEILTWDKPGDSLEGNVPLEKISISEEEWGRFLMEMDRLEVWQWKEHYDDGSENTTWWILHLKVNDKEIRTGGTGSWPGEASRGYSSLFKEFLSAVRELIGQRDFGHF